MSEERGPQTDPLINPFLSALFEYREAIRQKVELLTDDELDQVYDLFNRDNLPRIPHEFWAASYTVRARIQIERRRRAARAAAITPSGVQA